MWISLLSCCQEFNTILQLTVIHTFWLILVFIRNYKQSCLRHIDNMFLILVKEPSWSLSYDSGFASTYIITDYIHGNKTRRWSQTWMTKKSRATSEFVHVQRFEQQHTYVGRLLVPVGIIYRKVRVRFMFIILSIFRCSLICK
jgi:hypothetical protein